MNTFYPTIFTVLSDGTEMPRYAHEGDAAVDLVASEDVTIMPGEWKKVGSGLRCAIPRGFVGLVVPRSGLGCKGLVLKNEVGIIDSTFRGEIGLTLYNNNPTTIWKKVKGIFVLTFTSGGRKEPDGTIHVRKGDRVAQMLIMPVAEATFLQASSLDDTERGEGSFGSTGVRL
jgi:dUTP pyrophosphatase